LQNSIVEWFAHRPYNNKPFWHQTQVGVGSVKFCRERQAASAKLFAFLDYAMLSLSYTKLTQRAIKNGTRYHEYD
jgi:hypothetical protein